VSPPRIDIDDNLETQEEFWALLGLLNGDRDRALGQLVRFFRIAQAAFVANRPITEEELVAVNLAGMIQSGWAVPIAGGFRAKGAEKHFAWLKQRAEASAAGGRARAKAPRDTKGRLMATSKRGPGEIQPDAGCVQPESSPLAPALALNTNTITSALADRFDFEALYALYPKRKGDQGKKKALEYCRRNFSTDEKYSQLLTAAKNYARHCEAENKIGTEFVKQFLTFVRSGSWEEWVEVKAARFEPRVVAIGGARQEPIDAAIQEAMGGGK
jgi:hypothetical protein